MKISGKKLILLFLCPAERGAPLPSIPGRTRLMKMAFLFEKELWPDLKRDRPVDECVLPEFFAWKYGPFSAGLLNDLEFLINRGFVQIRSGAYATREELEEYEYWIEEPGQGASSEYVEEEFLLTDRGTQRAESLWEELTEGQRALVAQFRTVLVAAPLSRILEYVYKKYSEEGYTDRSLIRDRYLQS